MLQRLWHIIQQWSWLVLALTCWFFAMAFWAATTKTANVVLLSEQKQAETRQQVQPETIAASTDLGMLTQQVNVLQVSERLAASSEHEPEFRGTKFIKEQQNRWTIELFRVTSEAVIRSYLNARSDRSQYYYFRLMRPQQSDSFILVYGNFAGQDEAQQQLQQLQKNWTYQLKPQVQQFARYMGAVNDLGADELKSKLQLNAIKLTAIALPKTLLPQTSSLNVPALAEQPVATQTTIVQRDIKGNVVGVRQSKTHVLEPNLKPSNPTDAAKAEIRSPQRDPAALPNANN